MTRRETGLGRKVRQAVPHRLILRALACAAAFTGCVTAVPMQTASAVPRGVTRVGGELAATPYCSLTLDPLNQCARLPTGIPAPELRLDARVGLGGGLDVGGSARASILPTSGAQLGLLVDAKKEVWSAALAPGRRQLLSVAPGVGADLLLLRFSGPNAVLQASLPVSYGYQTDAFEWVGGARLVERFTGARGEPSGFVATPEFGFSAGFFARGPVPWGLQLAYEAPFELPAAGLITLSGALMFDVGAPAP